MKTVVAAIWETGEKGLRKTARQRNWGDPPQEVLDYIRSKEPLPRSPPDVRALWSKPFRSLEDIWDETYLREFGEVVDKEHWGEPTWKAFLTPWARDFVGDPPPFVARNMGWAPIKGYERELKCRGNRAWEVDEALRLHGIEDERESPPQLPVEPRRLRKDDPPKAAEPPAPSVTPPLPLLPPRSELTAASLALMIQEKELELTAQRSLLETFQSGGVTPLLRLAVDAAERADAMARRHVRDLESSVREREQQLLQEQTRLLRYREDAQATRCNVYAARAALEVWEQVRGSRASPAPVPAATFTSEIRAEEPARGAAVTREGRGERVPPPPAQQLLEQPVPPEGRGVRVPSSTEEQQEAGSTEEESEQTEGTEESYERSSYGGGLSEMTSQERASSSPPASRQPREDVRALVVYTPSEVTERPSPSPPVGSALEGPPLALASPTGQPGEVEPKEPSPLIPSLTPHEEPHPAEHPEASPAAKAAEGRGSEGEPSRREGSSPPRSQPPTRKRARTKVTLSARATELVSPRLGAVPLEETHKEKPVEPSPKESGGRGEKTPTERGVRQKGSSPTRTPRPMLEQKEGEIGTLSTEAGKKRRTETSTPSRPARKGGRTPPSPKKPEPELVLFRDLGKELLVPTSVPSPPYIADYFSKETQKTYTPEECEAMWRHRQRAHREELSSSAPREV